MPTPAPKPKHHRRPVQQIRIVELNQPGPEALAAVYRILAKSALRRQRELAAQN